MSITELTPKLTAAQITQALMYRQDSRVIKIPRYTPEHWWECDLFTISEAGYATEYEIKLSRADFLADAKKDSEVRGSSRWIADPGPNNPHRQKRVYETETKHGLLAQLIERGPSLFWFVLPMGMIPETQVPGWAGIMEFTESPRQRPPWSVTFHVVRRPPRRHEKKCEDKHRLDVYRTAYHRWHGGGAAMNGQLDQPRDQAITDVRELQWRFLYSLVVAGKSAKFADAAMDRWWEIGIKTSGGLGATGPFGMIRQLSLHNDLLATLQAARTGNYTKLERAFRLVSIATNLDLLIATPEQLERIPGCGPKTSRFFIIWTRPDARVAALDVHILRWLRYAGYEAPNFTPPSTPGKNNKYARLEQQFLTEADRRNMTARQLDLRIWEWCQAGKHRDGQWPKELQR